MMVVPRVESYAFGGSSIFQSHVDGVSPDPVASKAIKDQQFTSVGVNERASLLGNSVEERKSFKKNSKNIKQMSLKQ
jgi:hypothetical protein